MNRTRTSNTTDPSIDLELLRLPELQKHYAEVLGEPTRCPNRAYLIRRIVETLASRAVAAAPSAELANASNVEAIVSAGQPVVAAAVLPISPAVRAPSGAHDIVHQRGRLRSMTVEELQTKYLEIVGRPTGSTNSGYLVWKIREAVKGRVPIGPRVRETHARDLGEMKTLPFRIATRQLEQLDAAWRAQGAKNRMDFLRSALGHYLGHIGAAEAATLFTVATP